MSEITANEITKPAELSRAEIIAKTGYDMALAVKVDCPEMFEVAGEELRAIVTRRKEIETLRLSLTRPLDESKRRIMDMFRAPTERMGQAESLLRDEMTRYQREEREKAEAARRQAEAEIAVARAEAERREREMLEAAHAAQASGDTKAAATAEARAEEAREQRELADVAPPPAPVTLSTPKATGVSTRKNWKAEVTDVKALVIAAAHRAEAGDDSLLAFLQPDTKAIGGAARSMRDKLKIPGVRVYADDVLSVRKAS